MDNERQHLATINSLRLSIWNLTDYARRQDLLLRRARRYGLFASVIAAVMALAALIGWLRA